MPHGLYPDDFAAQLQADSGRKWRPSNGTEGEIFVESWCCQCSRDADEDCPILAATFAHDVDDPAYPPEWQIGQDGQPKCTAWLAVDDPPQHRCTATPDLFTSAET